MPAHSSVSESVVNRINCMLVAVCSIIMILNCDTIQAQDEGGEYIEKAPIEEVFGIILDRSVTFVGHDFYRYFSDYWRLKYTDSKDVLIIYERPSARWGSLIWVEYRSRKLVKLFISPSNKTREIAERVADEVGRELTRIKFAEQFLDTFDMDKDEI